MTLTAHVYHIHINADADQVWAAITQSEWKRRYFHGTSYAEGPTPGARYRTVKADGGDAVDGMIEEMTPPGAGTPGRFVQTWHVLYDTELAAEPLVAPEYVEVVDPGTMRTPVLLDGPLRLLVAARLGATRLIDNLAAAPSAPPA